MGTFYVLKSLLILVQCCGVLSAAGLKGPSFDQNYYVSWANDHVQPQSHGRELQLSMDKSSGSGIASKLTFGSGFFRMRLKLPRGNSAGTVTAFYLASRLNPRDELDFEFLGNLQGHPIILQTNIFTSNSGNREQKIKLWFDPSAAFHTYKILWNPYQVVFYVDEIPIRVYMNKVNKGAGYPSRPMQVMASLWDGDSWATNGGKIKVDWNEAPFKVYLRSFSIWGCPSHLGTDGECQSSKYWWNRKQYWRLDPYQQRAYQAVKKKYLIYDYCSDRDRHPKPPPECPQ